jgi:hypothetical protein
MLFFVDGDRPYSFIRRAQGSDLLVKITPTKSRTLYEWYKRAKSKNV